MQANVTTTSGATDWHESKSDFGLVKGKSTDSPQQSIYAGIRQLFRKGADVSNVTYTNEGKTIVADFKWKSSTNSWYDATMDYNGKTGHKEAYVKNVYNYWNNSFFSKEPKFYVAGKPKP